MFHDSSSSSSSSGASSGASSSASASAAAGDNTDRMSSLPQDILRHLILPALLPTEAGALSQVNHAVHETIGARTAALAAAMRHLPVGARLGDFYNRHAALMQDPKPSARELRRHLTLARMLFQEVNQAPADQITAAIRNSTRELLTTLRRSAAARLAEVMAAEKKQA